MTIYYSSTFGIYYQWKPPLKIPGYAPDTYPKLAAGGLQHIQSSSEYTHKLVWLYTNAKGQR